MQRCMFDFTSESSVYLLAELMKKPMIYGFTQSLMATQKDQGKREIKKNSKFEIQKSSERSISIYMQLAGPILHYISLKYHFFS